MRDGKDFHFKTYIILFFQYFICLSYAFLVGMFFISFHITRLSAKNASTLNAQDISLFKMVSIIEYYLPEEIRVAICLIYPS